MSYLEGLLWDKACMKAAFGAALGIDIPCLTSCGVQVTIKTQNLGST